MKQPETAADVEKMRTGRNDSGIRGPNEASERWTLHVCGLNHMRVPVQLREPYALSEEDVRGLLRRLRGNRPDEQALVLSTCNRTEIYLWSRRSGVDHRLRELFLELGATHDPEAGPVPLYQYQGLEGLRHLFAVVSGLDSMILGENQIKQQLRRAYELAIEEGNAGSQLHQAIKTAFATGKRIRTETALNEGTLCVAKAAVLQAEKRLGGLTGKRCLVIGAGKIGRIAATALAERQPSDLWIVNRTPEHARELCQRTNGEGFGLEALPELLPKADFVLGAAYAPELMVRREDYEKWCEKHGRAEQVCMVDAAVPRIIDPTLGQIEGVTLDNIEAMEEIVESNRHRRAHEASRAWCLVEEEIERFRSSQMMSTLGPRIRQLQSRFDEIFSEESCPAGLCKVHSGSKGLKWQDARDHRLKQRLLHAVIEDLRREMEAC